RHQAVAVVLSELAGNRNKLREAATAKFGAEDATKMTGKSSPDEMAKQIDAAQVKEDGDSATINNKDDARNSLKLKRSNGEWKIDLGDAAKQAPFIKALGGVMADVAGEISDGKYKTADDAMSAMSTKSMMAM